MIIGITELMAFYGYSNKKAFSEYRRRHPDQFPKPLPGTKKWVRAAVVEFIQQLGCNQIQPHVKVKPGRKRNNLQP